MILQVKKATKRFGELAAVKELSFEKGINKGRVSILLVEQNVPQASELADRIYLMEDGRIVFEGGKEEALSDEHVKEVFWGI